jgi:predicted HTH transcriptional regulator
LIPEKVVSLPKKVDSNPKMVNLQFLHDYCEKSSEKTVKKTREKTRENILNAIKENPTITINELAILTGITTKGIEWQLKKLQTQGILSRIGGRKGGHWEIVKNDLHK